MTWILFVILGMIHIFTIYHGDFWIIFGTKAFIMPLAALSLARDAGLVRPHVRMVFIGLWFGWLGDVLLHFSHLAAFASGLVAFLIGHIFYIRAFHAECKISRVVPLVMDKPYLMLPYAAFFIYIIILLNGSLDAVMKGPVYLYCFVILLMSLMAASRFYAVSISSWWLVFAGSILFVASDFVLAINKFKESVPYARYIIMSTYITGQGLIAYGTAVMYKNN
jgi:uncharacterized membrane protein YhhN